MNWKRRKRGIMENIVSWMERIAQDKQDILWWMCLSAGRLARSSMRIVGTEWRWNNSKLDLVEYGYVIATLNAVEGKLTALAGHSAPYPLDILSITFRLLVAFYLLVDENSWMHFFITSIPQSNQSHFIWILDFNDSSWITIQTTWCWFDRYEKHSTEILHFWESWNGWFST